MSATSPDVRGAGARPMEERRLPLRSTETKASFKTTEFIAYLAMLAGLFVAGAVTDAGTDGNDVLGADRVWLYATILSIGYMVSRGLAKAGSREPYSDS